jgi:hypothetical protein
MKKVITTTLLGGAIIGSLMGAGSANAVDNQDAGVDEFIDTTVTDDFIGNSVEEFVVNIITALPPGTDALG